MKNWSFKQFNNLLHCSNALLLTHKRQVPFEFVSIAENYMDSFSYPTNNNGKIQGKYTLNSKPNIVLTIESI